MDKIKINGSVVNIVRGSVTGAWFQVDSVENFGVPVSQHSFVNGQLALEHMKKGGKVRTSGNVYEAA
jgi:hypothetical protein